MEPTEKKDEDEIKEEWNKLAELRDDQIRSGEDLSYNYLLKPEIVEIVRQIEPSSIIDIGCGSGDLIQTLANDSDKITGVDLSDENIRYADRRLSSDIELYRGTIEDYVSDNPSDDFEVATCNMVMQCVPEIDDFLDSVNSVLEEGGQFIFSFPHPCYWPRHWDYEEEEWFNYTREISIEGEFKISLERETQMVSTHIHRPLSMYFQHISENGMILNTIKEPMPASQIQQKYPETWEYPRFIIGSSEFTG